MEPDSLEVCEAFVSIAGETSHMGLPAAFVRLSGCNLRCKWCDTQRAFAPGIRMARSEVVKLMLGASTRLVVVTGGEPLLQAGCRALCADLVRAGKEVLLETNGSQDISGLPEETHVILDMKPPSSGQSDEMVRDNVYRLRPLDELKFVIADRADFDWSLRLLKGNPPIPDVNILMSPAYQLLEPSRLADWILGSRVHARLQLQLHRIIWPDGTDGRPLF